MQAPPTPISIWISVAALTFSGISLWHSLRTARRQKNSAAVEKRSEAFVALVDARFALTQVAFRLLTLEPAILHQGSGDTTKLHEFIAEAKRLESQVEHDIKALYACPQEVEAIEKHWEQAKGNLAVVAKSLDAIEAFEKFVQGK